MTEDEYEDEDEQEDEQDEDEQEQRLAERVVEFQRDLKNPALYEQRQAPRVGRPLRPRHKAMARQPRRDAP